MYVTYSFFQCRSANMRWMFAQVGVGNALLKQNEGVVFSKILGHGGNGGFSIWPDFHRYSFFIVWRSKKEASAFFRESDYFTEWKSRASSFYSFLLQPIKAHGKWSGEQPFENGEENENKAIAVLTRARIRWSKLGVFWKNVPKVNRGMKRFPGLIFANGIGEYPIFQQATISIWRDKKSMMEFAYHDPLHAKIVQRTRSENWYSEELFARFNVVGYHSHEQGSFDQPIQDLDGLQLLEKI